MGDGPAGSISVALTSDGIYVIGGLGLGVGASVTAAGSVGTSTPSQGLGFKAGASVGTGTIGGKGSVTYSANGLGEKAKSTALQKTALHQHPRPWLPRARSIPRGVPFHVL